jgi:PAS domain S-box-containing protein
MNIFDYLNRRSKTSLMILGFLLVVVIGALDYWTGAEVSFSIFYLIPIALVTWFAGRENGILVAVAGAATWLGAELLWGGTYTHPIVPYWNAAIRLGFFLIVVYLETRTKGLSAELQELLKESTAEAGMKGKLLDNVADSVILHDLKGNIIYVNEAACRLRGYSREEMLKKNMHQLNTPENSDLFEKRIKDLLKAGEITFESGHYHKDGTITPIEVHARVIDLDGRKAILRVGRDITERKRAEQEIREAEQRFRAIFDNATDGILLADLENKKFSLGNKMICQMLGCGPEGIKDLGVMDIHPKQDLPYVIDQFEKQSRKEILLAKDIPVLRKDGSVFYADVNSAPVTLAGKTYLLGIFRDITERSRAEYNLQERVKELKCIAEISRLAEQPGISIEKFVEKTAALLPSAWQYPEDACARITLNGLVFKTENFKGSAWSQSADLHVDGQKIGRVTVGYLKEKPAADEGPFLKEERELINVVADFLSHIIQHRRTEKQIKESEEKWRSILENAPNVILTVDRNGTILFINRTVSGFTVEETIGKKVYDFAPSEYHGVMKETIEEAFLTGKPGNYEINGSGPEGRLSWYMTQVGPVKFNDQIVAAALITIDITERKRAEEMLRDSEELHKALFSEALDGICLADSETGVIIDCNQALAALVGRSRAELIGQPQKILHPPQADNEKVSPTFKQHLTDKEEQILETQVITGKGDIREVEIKANFLNIHGKKLLQGLFHDITERKRAEEELRESEELFSMAFKVSADMMALTRYSDGRIIDINEKWITAIGLSREEAIGRTAQELGLWAGNADRNACLAGLKEKGKIIDFEAQLKTRSNTITCLVSAETVKIKGVEHIIWEFHDITGRKYLEDSLEKRMRDAEIMNKAAVGRELKLIELEREVNSLLREMGKEPRHKGLT